MQRRRGHQSEGRALTDITPQHCHCGLMETGCHEHLLAYPALLGSSADLEIGTLGGLSRQGIPPLQGDVGGGGEGEGQGEGLVS